MKICSKCKKNKPFTDFNKRGDRDTYRSHCKVCSYTPKPKRARMPIEEKKLRAKKACAKHNTTVGRKAKQAFYEAHRRAKKLKATPSWLTKKQKDNISFYYEVARLFSQLFGVKMEVDHVIPLKGKIISGLHVPENLQLMVKEANRQKNNRF